MGMPGRGPFPGGMQPMLVPQGMSPPFMGMYTPAGMPAGAMQRPPLYASQAFPGMQGMGPGGMQMVGNMPMQGMPMPHMDRRGL